MPSTTMTMHKPSVLIPNGLTLPKDKNFTQYVNFHADELQYVEPKKNSNGGMSVTFMYKDAKIYIQTPELRCPFGVNNYKRNDGRDNLSVQVQFNPQLKDAVDLEQLIKSVDQKHIKTAKANARTWFSAKVGPEAITALYKDTAIPSKQPDKYAATWRLKINAATQFYDEERNVVDVNSVQGGCFLTCLVECSPLWFVNNGISPTYTLVQAKVKANRNTFADYSLVDDDGDSQMQ